MGGVVTYLWVASDRIVEDMKEKRPQVTINVVPKRSPAKVADTAKTEEPARPAETAAATEAPATDTKAAEGQAPSSPGTSDAKPPEMAAAPADAPAAAPAATAEAPKSAEGDATDFKAALKASLEQAQNPNAALHPHPDPKLVEESELGPLPKVDAAGRQPWRVYARPFNSLDQRARIAVVITQLGLSPKLTHEAITELPPAVTLGFAPYAQGLADWIRQARENGHEVLLGLPMEPQDYPRNDPGPFGLMLANSAEENTKRLNWALSRVTGYVGVFSFMGSRFSVDKAAVKPVLEQLKGRGLLILDTRATPFSIMGSVAKEIGLPYAIMDISPDAEPNRGYIDRQLGELEEAALEKKAVVAVIHPYPITMLRVKRWIERIDIKKVVLAPISAVAQRPSATP